MQKTTISKIWLSILNYKMEYARFLPILFSLGSIIAIYVLIKDRLNEKIAILASLLMSLSLYQVSYAQTYESYSLGVLLAILCVYGLFKYLETKTKKNENEKRNRKM